MRKSYLVILAFLALANPAQSFEMTQGKCTSQTVRDAVRCAVIFALATEGISPEESDKIAGALSESSEIGQDIAALKSAIEAAQKALPPPRTVQ